MIERETPEETTEPRPTAHRRFARLVESPVGRRLVPRRLVVAVAASLGFLLGAILLSVWAKDWVKGWVDARPEFQLPFSEIKLEPESPAYLLPGLVGLLEQVRVEAGHPEKISLLTLDADALILDFRRSPWVEDVIRIDRGYRGLTVHLVYRRPVAVAQFVRTDGSGQPGQEVIDRSGVILPKEDIDRSDLRVTGLPDPLILIRDVLAPSEPMPGRRWKRKGSAKGTEDPDLEVLGAARLADFLRTRPTKTPAGRDVPRVVSIWNTNRLVGDKLMKGYFLLDAERNWIWWHHPPGAEPAGDPTAVEKWSMLMKWVDEHGQLQLKDKERHYLKFSPSGASIYTPTGS